MSRTISFSRTNDRGVEITHELPAKFEACERCEGEGTHLHPDIGGHAYSAEEFAESFDDEEREEYFRRGGRYDVRCSACNGDRVVLVPDEEACERTSRGRRLLALFWAVVEEQARHRAEMEHERRMGY